MNQTCVGDSASSGPTSDSNSTSASTTGTASTTNVTTQGGTETGGIKLDVGNADAPGGECNQTGCKQIDLLFAIDSSASMIEEINALRASAAFSAIVQSLENINCGDIDYRIALTDDNDRGFINAAGSPWWDSQSMTPDEVVAAFDSAAQMLLPGPDAALGCEHVLTSASDLLAGDEAGFLRPNALLVLVLITDVDDYGYYDQANWEGCMGAGICPCSQLCATSGAPVQTILDNVVALKGGDPSALSTIVLAGDPDTMEGTNFCEQPASCCGQGLECGQALNAPRLFEFTSLQGDNGVAADICAGAQMVPTIIEAALGEEIDLACQTFEPEG
jgi:hypothetical protein